MKSKKICYLIFNNSPSSIVRGTTFQDEYLKYKFKPIYFNLYSKSLTSISNFLMAGNYFLLSSLFNKINSFYILVKSRYFLLICHNYDAIIVIKYIKPFFLNKIKLNFKGKILYDFDDAVWVNYIMGEDNFKKIISNVDYVSCDNNFLLTRAKEYNTNSFILNGPTQIEKFKLKKKNSTNSVVLCWIGSPDTLFYLYCIYDVLEYIGARYPFVILKILGAGYDKKRVPNFEKIKTEFIPNYNESIMINELSNSDIGLFPMFNNELSKGRGLLKTTIYMSAGLPSITSRILDFSNIIIESVNGFTANSYSDWIQILEILINDETLRTNIGNNATNFISENYNKSTCFQQLHVNFLNKV
jgi:glycosyltransferase involved in cell wall biosynthesis